MPEKDTGPKVEHYTQKVIVSKPTIDELLEANRPYIAEIGKILGHQAAQEVEANLRKDLQSDLDAFQDGQIIDVPMVHVE